MAYRHEKQPVELFLLRNTQLFISRLIADAGRHYEHVVSPPAQVDRDRRFACREWNV